jgi:hypothetical protein
MDQKLYFQYFVQDDVEDGTLMDTKIPIDEVGVSSVFEWDRGVHSLVGFQQKIDDIFKNMPHKVGHTVIRIPIGKADQNTKIPVDEVGVSF